VLPTVRAAVWSSGRRELSGFATVIADDHPATLEGLGLVGAHPQLEVKATCGNLTDLRAALAAIAPDLLLTDFFFHTEPAGTILDLAAELNTSGVRTLVLSSALNIEPVRDTLAAGLAGFLPKTTPLRELQAAAVKVAAGGVEFGAWSDRLPDLIQPSPQQQARLSAQEQAVLTGLAAGKTQEQIARDLVVATSTVKTYVSRLYDKLQPPSRTPHGLVAYAYQHKLVD